MDITLKNRPIGGQIAAISSKSAAHRLLICAALAEKPTNIVCTDRSEDIDATVRCLNALGAKIDELPDGFLVRPIRKAATEATLDCGESGSTLRFLLPIAAAFGADATFVLHGRLPERPLSPLWELLSEKGIMLTRPSKNTLCLRGRLYPGSYPIAGNVSSQFITGLLFALPLLEGKSDIMLTSELESAAYVDLTLRALERFDIYPQPTEQGWRFPQNSTYSSPKIVIVEGDWSNAAFWLCAGAICRPMTVTGLSMASSQGDRQICDLLRRFGAEVEIEGDRITVRPAPLHGIDIDASQIPDLVPPLALGAACAEGRSRIFGAERLKIKESDRLQSVFDAISALGGEIKMRPDGLDIVGGRLHGGQIDSQNDHRIAMMAAIASTVCDGSLTLKGAQAVKKSYPRFWADFEKLVISDE